MDPSLSTALDTVGVSEVTFRLPWEELKPGPVGEYLEVIDVDPASQCVYEQVDLDHPMLLAQDGLAPSEGTPQFHQQMVYATASLTIRNFERALGRRALWRPGPSPDPSNPADDSHYVPRLRVYPHALREPNAYYSPAKVALLLGYFNAGSDVPGEQMPGTRVFTCLSHDIVAHETTHALLDGMNRDFLTPSNADVHAFHEAFADIVALFQHFTFPEILRHQISSTRGDIRSQQNVLGSMATQFGRTTGRRGALRDAIGSIVEGQWTPHIAKASEYLQATEPHERGSYLVAAVFDAFLSIYERRVADLLRIATNGTGVLEPGAIHPDLVNRFAEEAAKSAQHVLTMCIRALDYCPPTDITFGEYLRAIITADFDLVRNDDLNYRIAFIEAFRRRGIYPRDVPTLSVESLRWRGPEHESLPPSEELSSQLDLLREMATSFIYAETRKDVFTRQREMRRELHKALAQHFRTSPNAVADARFLGVDHAKPFEVRMARIAFQSSPDGDVNPILLLGLRQVDKNVAIDPSGILSQEQMNFERGSTLVANLRTLKIRYCIRKGMGSGTRLDRQREFALQSYGTLRATYLGARPMLSGEGNEPFAALHRGCC